MNTSNTEIETLTAVMKTLGFTEEKTRKHLELFTKMLLSTIATELLSRKGYKSTDGSLDPEETGEFIKDNYSEEDVRKISKEVGSKFITDYFTNLLQGASSEDVAKVEAIIKG